MAKIRRGNVILEIKDDQIDRFMNQGYDVIDEMGNVINRSVPQDVASLQKAFYEHEAEINSLKDEIKNLTDKLKAAKKETKADSESKQNKRTESKE